MEIKQAYQVLEVAENISDEDLKIKYKELAKKYHPDVCKDEPNKFKQINEAYQLILDYRQNPEKYEPKIFNKNGFWGNVVDFSDILFNGDFFRQAQEEDILLSNKKPIKIDIKISFHESILGCSKEISYTRKIKCDLCQGVGSKTTGNGCDKCDGFGRSTIKNGNMIFQSNCTKCMGKGVKKNKCENCAGKHTIDEKRNGNINIPPGSKNNDILRLTGEGNFVGRHMLGDAYADVNLKIEVEKHPSMSLQEKNVHSELTISLLEALEGVTRQVETVYGNKEITINPKSKNSDLIKIPKCGVKNTSGYHVVRLNVEYPKNISLLVDSLKKENDGVHSSV